jgi:N-acetylglutamate synthase-like GNAT family acetyltransferase
MNPPPPSTRFAAIDDIPELHALIERAYRGDTAQLGWTQEGHLIEGPRTDAATLATIITDAATRMVLAEADGAIIACVQVSDRGQGLTYMGQLAVDPRRQAQGLGRHMIATAEMTATEVFGARKMEMTIIAQRPELTAFYGRCGYALTGEERPMPPNIGRITQPLNSAVSG